jgi:two-component system sensor histidine kinase KdpD
MLAEAQRLRAQGLDILIGVVETHGRKETAALLDGLSLPPRRQATVGAYQRVRSRRRPRPPALILMDELAHSNAPGSRHPNAGRMLKNCWKPVLTFLPPLTSSIWKA